MSVFENIAFGLRVRREKKAAVRRRVEKYAGMAGVGDHLKKRVTALSGGQQQRVAIARSLIMEPEILLMDEPLSNLDARLRVSMRSEIKGLQQELGITTIYVTHDQEEALMLSDRIAVFRQGVVEQVGEPEELYRAPASEAVCCFIGATNRISAALAGALRAGSDGVGSDGVGLRGGGPEEGRRCYIRKEKIRLLRGGEAAAAGEAALAARVKRVEYSGMNVLYRVEILGAGSGGDGGGAGEPGDWELEVITIDNRSERFCPGRPGGGGDRSGRHYAVRRRLMRLVNLCLKRLPIFLLAAVLGWLVLTYLLVPLGAVMNRVFVSNGSFSMDVIKRLIASERVMRALGNSFVTAFCTIITVNLVGLFQVAVTEFFDIKFARVLRLGFFTPLIYSSIALVTGYTFVYGSRGALTQLLLRLFPDLNLPAGSWALPRSLWYTAFR